MMITYGDEDGDVDNSGHLMIMSMILIMKMTVMLLTMM